MEHIGDYLDYVLYRNSDGFIEGYKKTGKRMIGNADIGTGLTHIITNCRTIKEFEELMASNKSSLKPKPPKQPELF